MSRPQLHGTPLSHFTRKVRVTCDELAIAYDFVTIDGVMAASAAHYAGNPLMRIPTLVDGDVTVFDSDHIARYLVARAGADDRLGVRSEGVDDTNRLAVINGVMANEVVPILAARGGLAIAGSVYGGKLLAAIASGLAWLERSTPADDAPFDYRTIATICAWQHLAHYKLVDLAPYPRLAALVARFARRPSVAASAPPGQ